MAGEHLKLAKNLGTVAERIGKNGTIQLEGVIDDIVFIRLINENSSVEILPASKSLSELLINNRIKPVELLNYEIMQLNSGYICISQVNRGTVF